MTEDHTPFWNWLAENLPPGIEIRDANGQVILGPPRYSATYFNRDGSERGSLHRWDNPYELGRDVYGQCAGAPLERIRLQVDADRDPTQNELAAFRAGFEGAEAAGLG